MIPCIDGFGRFTELQQVYRKLPKPSSNHQNSGDVKNGCRQEDLNLLQSSLRAQKVISDSHTCMQQHKIEMMMTIMMMTTVVMMTDMMMMMKNMKKRKKKMMMMHR